MAKSVRKTPNRLVLSSILLSRPVCAEEMVAWIVSGIDVAEALSLSIGEAILLDQLAALERFSVPSLLREREISIR